jgi:hypothetical protein
MVSDESGRNEKFRKDMEGDHGLLHFQIYLWRTEEKQSVKTPNNPSLSLIPNVNHTCYHISSYGNFA